MPTPALLKLLREPSLIVMQRTGMSRNAIANLRRKHGIEAPTYSEWRWSPAVVARLGKVPDMEIARELGVDPGCVARQRRSLGIPPLRRVSRWLPHELALLGKLPDEAVAQQLGRSVKAVQAKVGRLARSKRRSLGMPDLHPAHRWLPYELDLLGKLPDEVVAQMFGRSVRAVATQRERFGRAKPKAGARNGVRKR